MFDPGWMSKWTEPSALIKLAGIVLGLIALLYAMDATVKGNHDRSVANARMITVHDAAIRENAESIRINRDELGDRTDLLNWMALSLQKIGKSDSIDVDLPPAPIVVKNPAARK